MLTPNGQCANRIEKVMLLSLWANTLHEETRNEKLSSKTMIFAGLGKPTYPINRHTIVSYLNYWQRLDRLTKKWHENPDLIEENSAIDYGDPRGDSSPRALMAEVMSSWYGIKINPDEVLFTVGGIGALRVIFETFNTHYEDISNYRIITPFPHYSAYSNNSSHRLHPIHVMDEPGYKLTAASVEASIKEAYMLAESDHGWPKAILICNPSNPLGTVIDADELEKIAEVLRQYPDLHIIFDEAYAEMAYVEKPSFISIAPDLKNRTVIMRSATKALSAAGERMAILLVFDPMLMNEMLNKNISYFIHAPRSAQMAYAQTMANLNDHDRKHLASFYKRKVDHVIYRLHTMGAAMPDPLYQVEATFYVLGDFSDLLGMELPVEAQRALQKTGKVTTDEELAYYLLFEDSVMITPLSYFGLDKGCGFMRITCSAKEKELTELMDRLEGRLFIARKAQNQLMVETIMDMLGELKQISPSLFEPLYKKVVLFIEQEDNCLTLKVKNQALARLQTAIVNFLDFEKQ